MGSQRLKLTAKILEEYAHVRELPPALRAARPSTASASASSADASLSGLIDQLPVSQKAAAGGPSASAGAMVLAAGVGSQALSTIGAGSAASQALMRNPHAHKVPKPKWHAPWKLMRVRSLVILLSVIDPCRFSRLFLVTLAGCAALPLTRRTNGLRPARPIA